MIYCVEDEESIQGMMVYTLTASGFEAKGVKDGNELWPLLESEKPELILLDLNLPGEDGISILNKLKANEDTADIPIIIATARDSEYDKVIGLDNGADDYLSKPFGMMEMVSRVKAVLRRCLPREEKKEIFTLGPLSLDDRAHRVQVDGETVKLTAKEYEILRLMLANPNELFSREELLKQIWGFERIEETRTVDVHIGTLRMKLGKCANSIQTVRGVGYRLVEGNAK